MSEKLIQFGLELPTISSQEGFVSGLKLIKCLKDTILNDPDAQGFVDDRFFPPYRKTVQPDELHFKRGKYTYNTIWVFPNNCFSFDLPPEKFYTDVASAVITRINPQDAEDYTFAKISLTGDLIHPEGLLFYNRPPQPHPANGFFNTVATEDLIRNLISEIKY